MKRKTMREKSRGTLIDRVVKATGRADCTEVIVLQQRARWVMPAVAAIVAVTVIVSNALFDPNAIVGGAIVGGIVGLALTILMRAHWLASCGDSIVLVQIARPLSGSHQIVGEWPYPVSARIDSGLVTKRVSLAGESYIMATQFTDRFRTIMGTA